jgi:hypothetical protein
MISFFYSPKNKYCCCKDRCVCRTNQSTQTEPVVVIRVLMFLDLVLVLSTEKMIVDIKSVVTQVEPYEFVTPPEKFVADKNVETVPSAPV